MTYLVIECNVSLSAATWQLRRNFPSYAVTSPSKFQEVHELSTSRRETVNVGPLVLWSMSVAGRQRVNELEDKESSQPASQQASKQARIGRSKKNPVCCANQVIVAPIRMSSGKGRRGSFKCHGGLSLPAEMLPDVALLQPPGSTTQRFSTPAPAPAPAAVQHMSEHHHHPPNMTSTMLHAAQLQEPSASEDTRTSPAVSTLVGDFHDRFWLPWRSRRHSCLICCICCCAQHRPGAALGGGTPIRSAYDTKACATGSRHRPASRPNRAGFGVNTNFGVELEAAVGAAVHAELCRVFDEISRINALLCAKHAAFPGLPRDGRSLGRSEGKTLSGAPSPGHAPTSANTSGSPSPPRIPRIRSSHNAAAVDQTLEEAGQHIYMLQKQVYSLERQLEAAIKDGAAGRSQS